MLTSYVIDAAHGADDVAVCDWNTRIVDDTLSYGIDQAATGIKLCGPAAPYNIVGGSIDNTTVRAGFLFRGITISGGETVTQATLKLYCTDYEPADYVDPNMTLFPPGPTFEIRVWGAKRFAPAPGFDECPGPAPGWGNLGSRAIQSVDTDVVFDQLVVGSGGPTGWGDPHEKPGWTSGTRAWYPTRFQSHSHPLQTEAGSSETMECGLRTLSRTIVAVPRATGYVSIDVTAIVQEIIGFDRSFPSWTARTYTMGESPSGYTGWEVREVPRVIAPNGYVYAFCGNGVYWTNGLAGTMTRGMFGASTTAPTGTTIGGEEQPDGAGTAIWRCVRNGQPPAWQSGDGIAFIVCPYPTGWNTSDNKFTSQPVPGWRTFATGDLGDAGKYPTLEITAGAAGTVAASGSGMSSSSGTASPAVSVKLRT